MGVPPAMPSSVAVVAVSAVSSSDWRSSESLPSAATPRAPPAPTSPATGPTMKSKKIDAISATTTDMTAPPALLRIGCGAGAAADDVRSALAAVATAETGGSSSTVHDRVGNHVHVRVTQLRQHGRREQVPDEL